LGSRGSSRGNPKKYAHNPTHHQKQKTHPKAAASALAPKSACDYRDPLCALASRYQFGGAVIGDTAFFSGGLDANDPTYPLAGSQLEAVDVATLAPHIVQTVPDAAINTTRYRQQLVPWRGDRLVMVGGQFDDRNGLSQKTLSLVVLDMATREWALRREFWQKNGGACLGRFLGCGALASSCVVCCT
jgi:hypothetical protein